MTVVREAIILPLLFPDQLPPATEVVRAFKRAVEAAERGYDPAEIDSILASLSEGGRQTTGAYRKSWR